MLSGAGVQRSETPAQSKHPLDQLPYRNCTPAMYPSSSFALLSRPLGIVKLSGAGVQRSGTPAQSKHPYPGTNCRGQELHHTTNINRKQWALGSINFETT